jgi:2-hydroxymuconate-semialdehyde hydrolase
VTGWSNWQFALPALDSQYQCIAPDLAGFGATDHPKDSPLGLHSWMRLWVDQCLVLLDELNIEKAHLVGNSMGGAIALHLLMDAPDRFERVVHMGPIGTPHKITPALDRLWGFYDDPTVQTFRNIIRWFVYDDAFLADRLDSIAQTRFEAAMNPDVQRSFKAMFPAPRQTAIDDLVVSQLALRHMDHPTLLIHGRDDHIVPMETSLHLLRHLPNAQLHIYGQCSHWIQVEYARSFNQLLAQFFSGQI